MGNAFRFVSSKYGQAPAALSPYQKAGQVWDERIGSAVAQARYWRWMSFASLFVVACLVAALAASRQGPLLKTFIVPVDAYGRPGRVELADPRYAPSAAEIAYFIADWVKRVRGRSVDPVVVKDNWLTAYGWVSGDAASALDHFARSKDPMAGVGDEAVNVEIASVLQRSPKSFEVNWRETTFHRGGRSDLARWTGLFTVEVQPPRDEAELRSNPLGVHIISFQWAREL